MHWTLAALMLVLMATAATLYYAPLSQLVGRRHLVEQIHVWTGYLLPLPILLGWLRSAALRLDTRRLNRFTPDDFAWLRSRRRRSGSIPVGKFNAGQKLNAAFTVGAVFVMLGTGVDHALHPAVAAGLAYGGDVRPRLDRARHLRSSSSGTCGSPPRTRTRGWACVRESSRWAGPSASTACGRRAGTEVATSGGRARTPARAGRP